METAGVLYLRMIVKRNNKLLQGGWPNAGKHEMKKLMKLMTTRMMTKRKSNLIEGPLGKHLLHDSY